VNVSTGLRLNICAATLTFGLAACLPRIALAGGGDAATAQALYDQGKALMKQSKYADACPKLEESQRLDPGSGTLLNLGDCYEHEGRTASAWSTFLEAAAAAKNSGNASREQVARDRAAAVAPKLSRIEIDVPDASRVAGLAVTRDDVAVGTPIWGSATPIDPGTHHVSAIAPNHERWDTDVVVLPGGKTQSVAIPVLTESIAPVTVPTPTASVAPSAPNKTEPASDHGGGLGTQKALAIVAGGVGVVGVALGTVFGLRSKSKHDEAEAHCAGSLCRDQTGVDLKSQALSAGNVSTVGFAVGIAGLVGGAVLWFTAGGKSESTTALVGIGPGAVSVKGAW
jgi:hypothetical protein